MAGFTLYAQEIKISDIEMFNLGDGKLFARTLKNEKPIDGRVRIITGYTTEYIDAGFSEGLADGKWEYIKNNKLSESMTYSKGLLEGEKLSFYNDGKTIKEKGQLKNGKANGVFTRYSSTGNKTYEKGMKDGIDDGPERTYNESGEVLSETIFKDGKAEGKSFAWINKGYGDAYLRTASYKNGVYDGEYSEIAEEGDQVKIKGLYVNGKKEGLWVSYKKNGMPNPAEEFNNGKIIKRITYYTDGKTEMESNFDENGKKHGAEKKYDWEDSSLRNEFNYVHGKQVGKQTRYMSSNQANFIESSMYNESGQKDGPYQETFVDTNKVKTKGQYIKDKKDGKWTYSYLNGFLYKEETYDNGKLVETRLFEK
jgi:antitoxin component YwqK of YwqJK toxin-antitoxin module